MIVANVKCSGCAHSITTKISGIPGVDYVKVDPESDSIDLKYNNEVTRNLVTEKLHNMGYPEATEENGLLLQIKSYANCMIGKITK